MLTFRLKGDVQENIDQAAGRYDVRVNGQGDGIANRIESRGVRGTADGRPCAVRRGSRFGGGSRRVQVTYDYGRRLVEYHARGETFIMRRLRVVDDVVALPVGATIDDAISASLNFRDGHWTPRPDGPLQTHVVRRRRSDNEGARRRRPARIAPRSFRSS